ncbi:hypothetical protein HDR66_00315, partial [bacterium]|nr:hypothetical protein [bacterium]
MTEELSTFKIIEVAYKSRLLFPTAKEFEDAVGMKWRTIVEYYNNEDSLNLESCYNRINDILTQTNEKKLSEYFTSKECLKDYVGEYIKASNFYNSLNWRDRNHSASKKKFCRLLFRRHILSGKELGGETVIFGSKYSDTELFNQFFPNNDYENPAIDHEWILLFVFDIVRPWDDNSRVRENENQKEVYLERFHNLWKILQDDMVSLQGNPLVDKGQIPQDLRIPYKPIMNVISVNMYSHLKALWSMWHTFLDYKLYINNLNSSASENGINYSGIWIDDADKGETRFWVFLGDGKLMCFERNDNIEWVYTLYFIWYIPTIYFYEIFKTYNMLCFYKSDNNSWAVLATSINPCTEEQNEISIQNDNIENSDKEKLLCPVILPTWVNWRSWKRLNKEDILYKEFYNVLMERPPYSICTSESKLARLQNRFIGRDLNYIYIYDGKLGEFRMSETS